MPSRIKLICLILFVFAVAGVLLTGNQDSSRVRAFAEGPDPGHTGAPGELTCATTGCHPGPPNSGPGQFTIEGPSAYTPGQTYVVTVRHTTTDTSRKRWGFQFTALDSSNNKAGDLQITSSTTQILTGGPGGNRQYIEHSFTGTFEGQTGGASWSFNWVAPATDIGPITFYAAGNQANDDHSNTGDQIYTTSASLFSGPPKILNCSIAGKALNIMGENFADGAAVFLCSSSCNTPVSDGSKLKKVSNDPDTPATLITVRKAAKSIAPGQTVTVQVSNPDGTASDPFVFTRPS
jgi:hypothetical protein